MKRKIYKPKFILTSVSIERKRENSAFREGESLRVELEFVNSGNTSKIKASKLYKSIYKKIQELK